MSDKVQLPIAVVAIDIGTTYSGYAFSLQSQFQNDPTKIYAFTNWIPSTGVFISPKTPTSLLLKPNKEFYKFGYDAEDEYAELAPDGEHKKYYFFRRFKMLLHRNMTLSIDTKIADAVGKELPAIDVFAHSISYFKKHAEEQLTLQGYDLEKLDIRWVLTVPAIWTEPAKQFMENAAKKAGIKKDKLQIALEPEAASLFCRYIPEATGADVFKSNSKYMVIDLGGGTADITVHKVDNDEILHEIHVATGGAWGGTKVDAAYEQFFKDLVGEDVWEEFRRNHADYYLEMFREFEVKKRTIKTIMERKIAVRVPLKLKNLFEIMKPTSFQDAVTNNEIYFEKIRHTLDRIKIDPELVQGFFRDPLEKLIEHLQGVLLKENVRGTKTFLLVGGFAESPIVQETLREKFPHIRLITPAEAGLTVLKGAVIFGHKPLSIGSRKSPFTYGIAVSKPFIDGHHPPSKRIETADGIMCKDIYYKYVEFDESVKHGSFYSVPLSMGKGSTKSRVRLYSSLKDTDPVFVTDKDCEKLGELIIDVSNIKGASNTVSVGLIFGTTIVTLEVREKSSGKVFTNEFDFY